jgi:hypothetical protein
MQPLIIVNNKFTYQEREPPQTQLLKLKHAFPNLEKKKNKENETTECN